MLSVIICSYNPRAAFLERTLSALERQSVRQSQWELLLVDNNSNPALSLDRVRWHSRARIIREEQQGLTHARLRGIEESSGELLVFVDDDNILESNYLASVLDVAGSYPFLGAFGGSIEGEFEISLPVWFHQYQSWVGVKPISSAFWSNHALDGKSTPIGAGMVLKRAVAEKYLSYNRKKPLRQVLDRCGDDLLGGGDIDMALTACDIGLGKGVFPELKMLHLIPSERMTLNYMERLLEGCHHSRVILNYIRDLPIQKPWSKPSWKRRLLNRYLERDIPDYHKRLSEAANRGVLKGRKQLKDLGLLS